MSLRAVIRWRLVFAGLTMGLVVAIATAATVPLRLDDVDHVPARGREWEPALTHRAIEDGRRPWGSRRITAANFRPHVSRTAVAKPGVGTASPHIREQRSGESGR